MSRRHWLDPLARQILKATGQLPLLKEKSNQTIKSQRESIDHELEELRQKQQSSKSVPSLYIDVNRATASEWRQLPGCNEAMVQLLMRLQKGGVQLSGQEDLSKLLDLPEHIAKTWEPYLIFHWYGDSPSINESPLVDMNNANTSTLLQILDWPKERVQRFIKERHRRPFENLADLQERLVLPPSTIEKLIGLVSFGAKAKGPKLPPRK